MASTPPATPSERRTQMVFRANNVKIKVKAEMQQTLTRTDIACLTMHTMHTSMLPVPHFKSIGANSLSH